VKKQRKSPTIPENRPGVHGRARDRSATSVFFRPLAGCGGGAARARYRQLIRTSVLFWRVSSGFMRLEDQLMTSTETKKTVAAISFHDNKNLSIDIEDVVGIDIGTPQELTPGVWFVDLIIRSAVGNVSLQLTSDSLEKLQGIQSSDR